MSVSLSPAASGVLASDTTGITFSFSDSGGINPAWMSSDRTTLYAVRGATQIRYSTDDCQSWSVVTEELPSGTSVMRETSDGEIVVATGANGSSQGKLYKSSGWSSNKATATFSLVKSSSATGNYFQPWSINVVGSRVLLAEYGLKDGVNSARYVYMSTDDGDTWSTVLDIGNTSGRHLHGVAWDQYWNRIWVTLGDSQTDKILYSDDEGDNWVTAVTGAASSAGQCVAIHVLPDCVLFLSDGTYNGIQRIDRTLSNKNTTSPTVANAYQIDSSGTAKLLGVSTFQAEGFPVFMTFQPTNSQTSTSYVIATSDGYTFWEVWEDTLTYTDKGAVIVVGPTLNGYLAGNSTDGRYVSGTELLSYVGSLETVNNGTVTQSAHTDGTVTSSPHTPGSLTLT